MRSFTQRGKDFYTTMCEDNCSVSGITNLLNQTSDKCFGEKQSVVEKDTNDSTIMAASQVADRLWISAIVSV
jgi:hypothetical protein